MKRAWTADLHIGHTNANAIIPRPFKSLEHMHDSLVREFNMRLKPEDACIHLGDLGMGNKHRIYETLRLFNGRWSLIRGNHDRNNGVKTIGDFLFVRIGRYLVFANHIPYYYTEAAGSVKDSDLVPLWLIEGIEKACDFSICGHVHNSWKHSFEGKIPTINVGVDVRDYRPMFDDDLIREYERIVKQ
jgi:calcineurin-like phosphoesterase family protein